MKKILKPGCPTRYSFNSGLDNTTCTMNFTRMTKKSKTMKMLEAIIKMPNVFAQDGIIEKAYGFKRPSRSWGNGLFSALHHFGFISYTPIRFNNRTIYYIKPTARGIKFYNGLEA